MYTSKTRGLSATHNSTTHTIELSFEHVKAIHIKTQANYPDLHIKTQANYPALPIKT